MICPLCQHRFDADEMACSSGCPLHAACKVLCCPRCHYRFVEESAIASALQRVVARLRAIARPRTGRAGAR